MSVGIAIGTVLAVGFRRSQMVFGELVPKNLAIAKPDPVARWSPGPPPSTWRYSARSSPSSTRPPNSCCDCCTSNPSTTSNILATPCATSNTSSPNRGKPGTARAVVDAARSGPRLSHRSAEHAMILRGNVDTVSVDDLASEVLELMSSGTPGTRWSTVRTRSAASSTCRSC